MLPEEAQFVSDLRMQVLKNEQQGLPKHAGLDKEDIRRALDLSRKDYQSAQGRSTASGVSAPSNAPAMDLESLFTTTKSG